MDFDDAGGQCFSYQAIALQAVDLMRGLPDAMAFARITYHHRFHADIAQRDVKLLSRGQRPRLTCPS